MNRNSTSLIKSISCYSIMGLGFALFMLMAGSVSCTNHASVNKKPEQLSDSTLVAIRDGFDTRVAGIFDAQKDKSMSEMVKVDWNESLAHSYPRTEYAAAQFWLNENIDLANVALDEYGQYFIDKPDKNRMNVGWHTEMALRLIELYGSDGARSPGLLKPETEKKVMEGIWTNVRGAMKEGPEHGNTMTENYTRESNTWYIHESENLQAQSFTAKAGSPDHF